MQALLDLFDTDPSEALYRAEAELSHADFLAFIDRLFPEQD